MRIDIAGVEIDNESKKEILTKISRILGDSTRQNPAYIVTPYSEFIVEAQKNKLFQEVLNQADISVPDGIGIIWAGYILHSVQTKNMGRITAFLSLLKILWRSKSLYEVFPEKISGSDIIWDVVSIAENHYKSIFLLGGTREVLYGTATVLKKRFPGLSIVGEYDGIIDDRTTNTVLSYINGSKADIVLIAKSPPQQEIWMFHNKDRLKGVSLMMGLGGTFDFISGNKKRAPKILQQLGLEWLWRLMIEPKRIGRIYRATVIFTQLILKEKKRIRANKSVLVSEKKK